MPRPRRAEDPWGIYLVLKLGPPRPLPRPTRREGVSGRLQTTALKEIGEQPMTAGTPFLPVPAFSTSTTPAHLGVESADEVRHGMRPMGVLGL